MADPIVLTIATERNDYVKEFEQSLENNGYDYKLLGLGQKWRGFEMKMDLYKQELSNLGDRIVIVCDSYDLLFIQNRKTILDKYHAIANDKVVVGLENIKEQFCNFLTICDIKVVEQCKLTNDDFPNFMFPNSGFLMGPASKLKDIFDFMLKHELKDDQYGLFKWLLDGNCSKVYFDIGLDFIFNYIKGTPTNSNEDVLLISGDKKEIIVKERETNKVANPAAIHMPAHYLDFGIRSEKIRNFIFPERQKIPKTEYMKQLYLKLCKKEFNYFGIWWIPTIFLFILMVVVVVIDN